MAWLQLSLFATKENAEHISDMLSLSGALAVTLQESDKTAPVFSLTPDDNPLWHKMRVLALFDATTDMALTEKMLQHLLKEQLGHYTITPMEDKDWERAWMDNFKPMLFGDKLWIYPSWHDIADKSACHLLLDPGLAFGTGTHPTTAMCLDWLAKHIKPGQRVIDYGCGSGILAIAALKLGASHVVAIDNDPQALQACHDNAIKNAIAPEDITISLPADATAEPADVVVANILAQPLVSLAPTIKALIKPSGHLILSGLLQEQTHEVWQAYQDLQQINIVTQEEWALISAKKN